MTWQKGWPFNITLDAHQCILIYNAMLDKEKRISEFYNHPAQQIPLSEKVLAQNYHDLFVMFSELYRQCKELDAKENAKMVGKKKWFWRKVMQ